MSVSDSRLLDALRLSERMLMLARRDAWEEVSRLERQRAGLLEACFGAHAIEDKDLATHTIRQLLELDRAIIALGRPRREQLATELDQLQQGRHASRVYANTRQWSA